MSLVTILTLALVLGLVSPHPAPVQPMSVQQPQPSQQSPDAAVRVFYAAEPGSDSLSTWREEVDSALASADDLLPDDRVWRWGETHRAVLVGETWQDRAQTARDHIDQVHDLERRLVIHEAGLGGHECGRASQPIELTYDKVNTAHVAAGCLDGRTVAHELLHTLGAVHPDAPASDGKVHSTVRGDLMSGEGDTVDAAGDSYWNPDPEPGTWLADNPRWNAAESPFVQVTR